MRYEFHQGDSVTKAAQIINDVYDQGTLHRWFIEFRTGNIGLTKMLRQRPPIKMDNDDHMFIEQLFDANPHKTT